MSASAMQVGHNNCLFNNNNNVRPVTFTWCRHLQTMLLSTSVTAVDHVDVIDETVMTSVWVTL